jgi:tocopherol O-methyltransferase
MIEPKTPQTGADIAGHYDELDSVYREIWGEHVHHGLWRTGRESVEEATDALSDLVLKSLRPATGSRVADIGCGYGATAARFINARGVHVTGFTLSEAQAQVARERSPKLEVHVRDWLDNGMPNESFDYAYAIESTEHIADKQRLFDEVSRTLKPGGRFVVCAWIANHKASRWQVRHLLEPICREGRLPGMGTRLDYHLMAETAGLNSSVAMNLTASVSRTWTIVTRRVLWRLLTDRRYRRYLFDRDKRQRQFALSLPRLILAYRMRAMHYWVFTFQKK